jgi:hypothetical protein
MQVVWHGKDQSPIPLSSFFAEFKGFDQFRPDVPMGKLVGSPGQTVDRDEKCFLSGIDPIGWIVRQMFPAEVHRQKW